MTVSITIACPCCGQAVEARYAGFESTTVEVVACDSQRAVGIVSWTMRKSAAFAAVVPEPVYRHRDGFVTLG
jgi:hypothetical protein